jgi:hypothetical protein
VTLIAREDRHFYWLLGTFAALLLGVMAHGYWF